MTDDRERETLYAVYLAAREHPQPPEYADLRALLPDADEATIGAIHGATGQRALDPDALADRLAAKDRATLGENEP